MYAEIRCDNLKDKFAYFAGKTVGNSGKKVQQIKASRNVGFKELSGDKKEGGEHAICGPISEFYCSPAHLFSGRKVETRP